MCSKKGTGPFESKILFGQPAPMVLRAFQAGPRAVIGISPPGGLDTGRQPQWNCQSCGSLTRRDPTGAHPAYEAGPGPAAVRRPLAKRRRRGSLPAAPWSPSASGQPQHCAWRSHGDPESGPASPAAVTAKALSARIEAAAQPAPPPSAAPIAPSPGRSRAQPTRGRARGDSGIPLASYQRT